MHQNGAPETRGVQTRRAFIRSSSAMVASGALGAGLPVPAAVHTQDTQTIRIGLIGCGRRGTSAAIEALHTTSGPVQLVAMADVFADRVQRAYRAIKSQHPGKIDVPRQRRFTGLYGYRALLESDAVDLALLATPPGFRPQHFEDAVRLGKHVFMEKPVATDQDGIQRIVRANQSAIRQGLAVAVGLQRRHEKIYRDTIARLQDGAIGRIMLTRAYWNGAGRQLRPRQLSESELEYQLRNWYYFTWLSGDHIVEQHIHNLDIVNWLLGGPPIEANGQGGRHVHTGSDHGQIFDHHAVEFTYADGTKLFSQCRQIQDCWRNVAEFATGTAGHADISGGKIYDHSGNLVWNGNTRTTPSVRSTGSRKAKRKKLHNGHQQQFHDLFAALRRGDPPNECDYGVTSTQTAIFGRLATYTGQLLNWNETFSSPMRLADTDALRALTDPAPVRRTAGEGYPMAVPGVTTVATV